MSSSHQDYVDAQWSDNEIFSALDNLPAATAVAFPDLSLDGQFSSDGEFTDIANREMAQLGSTPLNLDSIKFETEESAGGGMVPADLAVPDDGQVGVGEMGNAATSKDPCLQNWAGELFFRVRVQQPLKSKDAQYSDRLNKLYINQNRAVQIFYNVRANENVQPAGGLTIRAVAVYTRPDDFHLPVAVCWGHSRNSSGDLKSSFADHLVRCTSEERSQYFTDPESNRHSVLTELPEVQAGSNEVSLGYRFMDLGSCAGGLNRRDMAVIFTLEMAGAIVGRHVLPVRICTCPKRDMETDEKHERKNIATVQLPTRGKIKQEVTSEQEFWVLARGSTNYEALKKVGEVLDLNKFGSDPHTYNETVNRFNGAVKTTPGKRKRIEENTHNVA